MHFCVVMSALTRHMPIALISWPDCWQLLKMPRHFIVLRDGLRGESSKLLKASTNASWRPCFARHHICKNLLIFSICNKFVFFAQGRFARCCAWNAAHTFVDSPNTGTTEKLKIHLVHSDFSSRYLPKFFFRTPSSIFLSSGKWGYTKKMVTDN